MLTSQTIINSGRLAPVFALLLLLAACNSDSFDTDRANSDTGDKDIPAVRVATLEYFVQDGNSRDTSLLAVPPSQPDSPAAVDSSVNALSTAYTTFGITRVITAQSATPTSLNGLHVAFVLYPRTDGTLWRAGTDPESFPPQPIQVSGADNFNRICIRGVTQDTVYTDPDATPFVYVLAANGMGCEESLDAGTATWHFVLAGDSPSTAPRDFPSPDPLVGDFAYGVETKAGTVVNLQNSNGDNAGWLIRQEGMLTRVGPDGTVAATDIAPVTDMFQRVGPQLDNGILMLDVDDALMAFDPADNSLRDLSFALPTTSTGPDKYIASDGREAYIALDNNLYRTTGGGRDVVQIDVAAGDASDGEIELPLLGDERVVWLAGNGNGKQSLRSVDKAASDGARGMELAVFGDDVLQLVAANSGQWVFFQKRDFSATPTRISAVALRMDGSEQKVFTDSRWVGVTRASQAKGGFGAAISRIYRVPGLTDVRDTVGGKPLLSVLANDPANPDTTIQLGIIPSNSERLRSSPGFGPGRLVRSSTGAGDIEILFFQDDQPGGLQQITEGN